MNTPDQLVPLLSGAGTTTEEARTSPTSTNSQYTASVQKASTMPGATLAAPTWLQRGESDLFSAADVVPFANSEVETFGAKSRFDIVGSLIPTSIRMLAN